MVVFVHWASDQKLKKIVLWAASGGDQKPTEYSTQDPTTAGIIQLELPEKVTFHFELEFEGPGASGNLQLYQFVGTY